MEASLVSISISVDASSALTLRTETRLLALPPSTQRPKEEDVVPTIGHVPPCVQTDRGPGVVPRTLFGVHTRGHLHGCEPVKTCRGDQHDSSVSVDERKYKT